MSDATNVFGPLQPAGSTDPLSLLSGSPACAGIAAVVSALYGPELPPPRSHRRPSPLPASWR